MRKWNLIKNSFNFKINAKLKLFIPSFNIFSKFINLCDWGPIEKNIKNPNTIIKETSDNKKT